MYEFRLAINPSSQYQQQQAYKSDPSPPPALIKHPSTCLAPGLKPSPKVPHTSFREFAKLAPLTRPFLPNDTALKFHRSTHRLRLIQLRPRQSHPSIHLPLSSTPKFSAVDTSPPRVSKGKKTRADIHRAT